MGKTKWYTQGDVVVHNKISDIWVSVHGNVYDLTNFIKKYFVDSQKNSQNLWCGLPECNLQGKCICKADREIRLLLAFAGKDVSHWLKDGALTYKTYVHPVTTAEQLCAPHGTWLQHSRGGAVPTTKWRPAEDPCWFEDKSLIIGRLTKNPRRLKLINTLTGDSVNLEVCEEDTISDMISRYRQHNGHYSSYTWVYKGSPLDMGLTLTQNGIPDERELLEGLNLNVDNYLPIVHLCFNDDGTEEYPGPLS